VAEQSRAAVQEKLIAVQDELDRVSVEHERQRQSWQARYEQHLNQINDLQSQLGLLRQHLDDNRLVL